MTQWIPDQITNLGSTVIQRLTQDIYIVLAAIVVFASIVTLIRGSNYVAFLAFLGFVGVLAFAVRFFTEARNEVQERTPIHPQTGASSEIATIPGPATSKTATSPREESRRTAESTGRYFLGIDVGAASLDYCVFDYESFSRGNDDNGALHLTSTPTPRSFPEVCEAIKGIVEELLRCADQEGLRPISGIGLGLPGLVNPRTGVLVLSPSFGVSNRQVVEELSNTIHWEVFKQVIPQGSRTIPIKIDNDVRCATRFLLKRHPQKRNFVCIFIGNGLGSGIVLNGRMLYGRNFAAGEAGHTTVSHTPELFHTSLERCHCGNEGHHWEMYVCSYGILGIAKNLDPEAFDRFARQYLGRLNGERELTTEVLSDAVYEGDPYASRIVEKFYEYTALGVANYINVLNPEEIILGGGMIRAFCDEKRRLPNWDCTGRDFLERKVLKYAIPSSVGDYLTVDTTSRRYMSSLGAALIFRDESYREYLVGSDGANAGH